MPHLHSKLIQLIQELRLPNLKAQFVMALNTEFESSKKQRYRGSEQ